MTSFPGEVRPCAGERIPMNGLEEALAESQPSGDMRIRR